MRSAHFENLKRRVNDTDSSCYPDAIRDMIVSRDYQSLARFADAFRDRKEFTNNYVDNTGTDIHIRDVYDLFAYMSLNSNMELPDELTYEQAVAYIRSQSEETDVRELIFQVCNDQKEELFEAWSNRIRLEYDDFKEQLVMISKYLSQPIMNECIMFCTSTHDMRGVKPREIFSMLSVTEQMEIVKGEWKKVNILVRSTLYPVFLYMVYQENMNPTREVCVRHPYLMAVREYIDELAMHIVTYTASEKVIKNIVDGYQLRFNINSTTLYEHCYRKLRK